MLEYLRSWPGIPRAVEIAKAIVGKTNASLDQQDFRGREDTQGEVSDDSDWKAAVNTDWTQSVDENFRVRFTIRDDAAGGENNAKLQLRYNRNSLGWNDVNATSSVVRSSVSTHFAEDDDTTQQISTTSGTFITPNSGMDEDDGLAGENNDIDFVEGTNDEVEVEYCVQIRGVDVNNSDTIELRVERGSGVLENYTNTPTVTVSKAGSSVALSSNKTSISAIAATVALSLGVTLGTPGASLAAPAFESVDTDSSIALEAAPLSLSTSTLDVSTNLSLTLGTAALSLGGQPLTVGSAIEPDLVSGTVSLSPPALGVTGDQSIDLQPVGMEIFAPALGFSPIPPQRGEISFWHEYRGYIVDQGVYRDRYLHKPVRGVKILAAAEAEDQSVALSSNVISVSNPTVSLASDEASVSLQSAQIPIVAPATTVDAGGASVGLQEALIPIVAPAATVAAGESSISLSSNVVPIQAVAFESVEVGAADTFDALYPVRGIQKRDGVYRERSVPTRRLQPVQTPASSTAQEITLSAAPLPIVAVAFDDVTADAAVQLIAARGAPDRAAFFRQDRLHVGIQDQIILITLPSSQTVALSSAAIGIFAPATTVDAGEGSVELSANTISIVAPAATVDTSVSVSLATATIPIVAPATTVASGEAAVNLSAAEIPIVAVAFSNVTGDQSIDLSANTVSIVAPTVTIDTPVDVSIEIATLSIVAPAPDSVTVDQSIDLSANLIPLVAQAVTPASGEASVDLGSNLIPIVAQPVSVTVSGGPQTVDLQPSTISVVAPSVEIQSGESSVSLNSADISVIAPAVTPALSLDVSLASATLSVVAPPVSVAQDLDISLATATISIVAVSILGDDQSVDLQSNVISVQAVAVSSVFAEVDLKPPLSVDVTSTVTTVTVTSVATTVEVTSTRTEVELT